MTGAPSSPHDASGHLTYRYEVDGRFHDALVGIIPSAAVRLVLREVGIQRVLDRLLRAYRENPQGNHPIHINGDQGLILTDPFPDASECMVMFEFDPALTPGSTVHIWGVREVHREAIEDDS